MFLSAIVIGVDPHKSTHTATALDPATNSAAHLPATNFARDSYPPAERP